MSENDDLHYTGGYDDSEEDSESSEAEHPQNTAFRSAIASKMPSKMPSHVASKQPRYATKRPYGASKSVPSKRPRHGDADHSELQGMSFGDEDEDEEEYEEEIEDEPISRRSNVSQYFDTEADDDDDEEDDEEVAETGFEESENYYKELEERRRKPRPVFGDDRYGSEIDDLKLQAQHIVEKYGSHRARYDDDVGGSKASRTNLLPSIRDPKLWLLKCKTGKERVAVLNLMNLYYKKVGSGADELFIKSAFTTDSSPGYVYIEADKEAHVRKAIENSRFILPYKISLVPIEEMVQALTVREIKTSVKKGQWVRIKRGIYKDDVAQVVAVHDQQTQITVRIIPRIDYHRIGSHSLSNKSSTKPLQKLFKANEIRDLGGLVDRKIEPTTGLSCHYFASNYYRKGFLYKNFRIDNLETSGVNPTVLEMEMFQTRLPRSESDDESDDDDKDDFALIPPSSSDTKVIYARGDTVRVIRGDLKNLTGTVISVFGDTVKIMPLHEELSGEPIEFPINDVYKFFKLGDHVKIVRGEYVGETGHIVRVEDDQEVVIVFSDISMREMKVLSQDIIESSEVTTGRDTLGNFELYDLVSIQRDVIGVIVRVEMGYFRIMDQKGVVHRVRLQDVKRRRESKFAVALDSLDNEITRGDILRVNNGSHRDKQGTVKHIYRAFVFLLSREIAENGGIFVVRARDCSLVGQIRPASRMSAAAARGTGRFRGRGGNRRRGGPGRRWKDPLIGETVKIKSGPYKSLLGIVKDANDQSVRVELHSQSKIVSVSRDRVVKPSGDSLPTPGDFGGFRGSRTPGIGSRTPASAHWGAGEDPSKTPHYMPRTPMGAQMGQAWATTPMPHDWGGARTPSYPLTSDYAPQTPGLPNTPMTNTPLPNTPAPRTPGGVPATPFGATTPRFPNTPNSGFPMTPSAPMTPAPITPNTPFDYDPQTPGPGPMSPMDYESQRAEPIDWAISGACVSSRIYDEAVVVENQGDHIVVMFEGDKQTLPVHEVTKIGPSKGDEIILVSGENKGKTGTLIQLDGSDGIVKFKDEITILSMSSLAKYKKV